MATFFGTLKRFGLDGFILALGAVILLAYMWPTPGVMEEPVSLSTIAGYGVSLIFFFYGLKLSPSKFANSLRNWRLHVLVQASTFLFFPVVVFLVHYTVSPQTFLSLWWGVLYIAALPSTVSSSVVMVSIAKGNVPAAIFNASISGLIGIILTPIIMSPVLEAQLQNFEATHVIMKLGFQVLLPVALGMLLHSTRLGTWTEKHLKQLRYFDQSVILMIVYVSFCESFAGDMFTDLGITTFAVILVCVIALFALVFGLIYAVARILHFEMADRITAVFCGTKKSLIHATVMSKVLFAGLPSVGVVLLPIMIYHAAQLIMSSILAQRFAARH